VTLTLLLDLDDTLLVNDIDGFLPAYLQALTAELTDFGEPDRLKAAILAAVRQASANQRPDCTLQELFDAHFYPAIAAGRASMQPALDRFYNKVYPTLRSLTQPVPGAVDTVEWAFECGWRVAIATNPLFPRTANLQRLEWAGLPIERYPFELVTSIEDFHFAKPNPAYYAEVLARLGWPEGPVVMVGDSWERDILPAQQLGLAAFWQSRGQALPRDGTATGVGNSLSDLRTWLEGQPAEALQPNYDTTPALTPVLRSTPAALASLCQELGEATILRRPLPDEWSLTEILCHLRDVDREVNLPRLQKVLNERNPFLPGKDTDPWAEERLYICQNGLEALHKFTATRMELLDVLDRLPADGWQLPARHAIFGPTDVAELIRIVSGHDRLHIQQVVRNLNHSPE
jgi:FMN phosphatase YigB (HAD superfamily)